VTLQSQTVSHDAGPDASTRPGARARTPGGNTDSLLSFAAAPVFAIMAMFTAIHGDGMAGMLCSATHDQSMLTGMLPMYVLMSAFHLPPWFRLITRLAKICLPVPNRPHTNTRLLKFRF
jgi:hypothetical protein